MSDRKEIRPVTKVKRICDFCKASAFNHCYACGLDLCSQHISYINIYGESEDSARGICRNCLDLHDKLDVNSEINFLNEQFYSQVDSIYNNWKDKCTERRESQL
ncbi:MAG: hypothetical protein ACRC11_19715 [Xenococcaceae cyanobacterium]